MGGTIYNLSNEEKEINEWSKRSRKEGICCIVSCINEPTTRCKKCTNYCCSEHFPPHLDSSDFEYNNNSSSNDGLELYMEEDESDDSDESSEMSLTILCKY